jgi:hypothetical protein
MAGDAAKGGFGAVMTCRAHVVPSGQGFPGQLSISSDLHIDGLSRLATGIKQEGSLAIVQLFHAGSRSPRDLIGQAPLFPIDDPSTGSRGMTTAEVEELVEGFIVRQPQKERRSTDPKNQIRKQKRKTKPDRFIPIGKTDTEGNSKEWYAG